MARRIPFRILATFPLREQRGRWQLLLLILLYTGLQIAFPPLALALEAGYAAQVARRILIGEEHLALPQRPDWKLILLDGARRWGLILLFSLPGWLVACQVAAVAGYAVWVLKVSVNSLRLASAILVFGLSFALLLGLIGAELANVAAMHMLLKGSFAAGLDASRWLPVLRARLARFELAALGIFGGELLFLAALAMLALPALFLCVGPLALFSAGAMYLRLVSTAWYATIYKDGLDELSRRAQAAEAANPAEQSGGNGGS